jgi:hypothetical protein
MKRATQAAPTCTLRCEPDEHRGCQVHPPFRAVTRQHVCQGPLAQEDDGVERCAHTSPDCAPAALQPVHTPEQAGDWHAAMYEPAQQVYCCQQEAVQGHQCGDVYLP